MKGSLNKKKKLKKKSSEEESCFTTSALYYFMYLKVFSQNVLIKNKLFILFALLSFIKSLGHVAL